MPVPLAVGAAARGARFAGMLARLASTANNVRRVASAGGLADQARKSGAGRFVVIGLAGLLLLTQLLVAIPTAIIARAVEQLAIRPAVNVAMAAYQASQACDFAGGRGLPGALLLMGQAYEATGAGGPTLAHGASPFGYYRNPLADAGLPGYDPMRGAQGITVEPQILRKGGEVYQMLGLDQDRTPQQWTSLGPWIGEEEHGIGFLLIRPRDWKEWTARGPRLQARLGADHRGRLDPYRPHDAFLVMACHLQDLVDQSLAGKLVTTFEQATAEALATLGDTVQQVWREVREGVDEIRDALAKSDLPAAAAGVARLRFHVDEDILRGLAGEAGVLRDHGHRLGAYYYSLLRAFAAARAGTPPVPGTTSWPAPPAPLPLGTRGMIRLPDSLWYPQVPIPGFDNPFPDSSQCTWWAYQAFAAFNRDALLGVTGDGGDWLANALGVPGLRGRLLTPGMQGFGPVEGSVISFARTLTMGYGHVAIVREVARDSHGDVWMLLWDANWDLQGGRYQHWERWNAWEARVAGFILPPPHASATLP